MIQFIDEVNRVLWACDKIGPDGADIESVLQLCSSVVLRARLPKHAETIEFCKKTGLVELRGNWIKLTPLGKKLWAANPDQRYELTKDQKQIFVSECLLTEEFKPSLQGVFAQFVPDYSAGVLRRSKVDDPPLTGDSSLLAGLKDLGLILETETGFAIGKQHAKSMMRFASNETSLSDLKDTLALQEQIGEFAEGVALSFERGRLESGGFKTEAELVQRVSEINTAAGFDLRSFDGKSENLVHDRFIEVKGSTKAKLNFFISRNELATAKKLGKTYWLYFIGSIDLANRTSRTPVLLQNPYELFSVGKLKTECVLYQVSE